MVIELQQKLKGFRFHHRAYRLMIDAEKVCGLDSLHAVVALPHAILLRWEIRRTE